MLFGLTYAQFVAVVITAVLAGGESGHPTPDYDDMGFDIALTTSINAESSGASDESTQITASYVGHSLLFDRYEPVLSSGLSEDGLF
jgi:hypothetical protein